MTDTESIKAVRFFESRHFFIEVTCFKSFDLNRIQGNLLICCLIYFNCLLNYYKRVLILKDVFSYKTNRDLNKIDSLVKLPLKSQSRLIKSRNLLVFVEVLNAVFTYLGRNESFLDFTLKKKILESKIKKRQ